MPKQQKPHCRGCRFSALCLSLGFEGMLDKVCHWDKAGEHDSYIVTLTGMAPKCLGMLRETKKGKKDAIQKSKN